MVNFSYTNVVFTCTSLMFKKKLNEFVCFYESIDWLHANEKTRRKQILCIEHDVFTSTEWIALITSIHGSMNVDNIVTVFVLFIFSVRILNTFAVCSNWIYFCDFVAITFTKKIVYRMESNVKYYQLYCIKKIINQIWTFLPLLMLWLIITIFEFLVFNFKLVPWFEWK